MKKSEIVTKVSNAVSIANFKVRKHSPEILIIGGCIGTVVSAVMACRATLKIDEILEESKEKVDNIHKYRDDEAEPNYTVEQAKKDLFGLYVQTGFKLVKLYAPAVILGTTSLGCVVASNNILRKRNAALAAAYATIDKSFKEYRSRVVERYGEDVDRQLKYNLKEETVTVEAIGEDGKKHKVKKPIERMIDDELYSEYAVLFDSKNPYFENNRDINLMMLRAAQAHANDKLVACKFVFLNDVLESIGFKGTKAGQVVGWVYDEEHPIGDNKIDFGIYDVTKPSSKAFIEGGEPSVIIDFNVDGNVWALMADETTK